MHGAYQHTLLVQQQHRAQLLGFLSAVHSPACISSSTGSEAVSLSHCMHLQVFEKLGPSLFDFLRKNEYRPFPIDLVQEFSRQLLASVCYMHELQLVHTDLKPENILLCSLDYCRTSSMSSSGSV
jgi:serine/threonine protein kinase